MKIKLSSPCARCYKGCKGKSYQGLPGDSRPNFEKCDWWNKSTDVKVLGHEVSWWIHTELYDYCSYNIANFLAQCMANWYVSWESKSFSSKNFTYHMFRLLDHTYHQITLFKLLIKINRLMALHLVPKARDVCYSCSESQM